MLGNEGLDIIVDQHKKHPAIMQGAGASGSMAAVRGEARRMQGDILPYLKDRTFDPDATRTMDEAYEKARRMLGDRSQPPVFLEILAKRIIYWATTGDGRNSDQLARRALEALGYDPDQL